MKVNTLSMVLRILIAIIFLQTLYFKFTAHPDSVHIFSALGVEPYGRIGLGIVELFTIILILINRTKIIGIILSLGIITGAIVSHILVIGINVKGDNGVLFSLAIIVFVVSILLIYIYRFELKSLTKQIKKDANKKNTW